MKTVAHVNFDGACVMRGIGDWASCKELHKKTQLFKIIASFRNGVYNLYILHPCNNYIYRKESP